MQGPGELFSFEIGELIATFRDAVLALKPVADRAHLSWRDEDAHDEWERLVEAAFDAFVRSPIFLDPANRAALPLARYDFNIPTYAALSWIEAESADGQGWLALVRIEAGDGDFCTMHLEEPVTIEGSPRRQEVRLWAPDVKLRFARRDPNSTVSLHDTAKPSE